MYRYSIDKQIIYICSQQWKLFVRQEWFNRKCGDLDAEGIESLQLNFSGPYCETHRSQDNSSNSTNVLVILKQHKKLSAVPTRNFAL